VAAPSPAAGLPDAGPFTLILTASPSDGPAPLLVEFNASVSAGTATAADWTFGDGSYANLTGSDALAPAHIYAEAGVYEARVKVWEGAASQNASLEVDALGNLLANALKYGGTPPTVRLRASRIHDGVSFEVIDNGDGIEHGEHRIEIPVARGGHEGLGDLALRRELLLSSAGPLHAPSRTARELPRRHRRAPHDGADLLERDARAPIAFDPKADSGNLVAVSEHEIGEIELTIKFEGPSMNGEGAGSRAGLGGFVDDSHLDPELGQPERQNQAGRSSADDQNVAAHHVFLR